METEASPGYIRWLDEFEIKQGQVKISPNKEAKEGKEASSTSIDSLCEALLFVMDGANYPLWIHCNQGRHRTGCVVACLRKIQGTPIQEIIDEYVAYANPKVRPGDIALIKSFDPSAVYSHAKQTGFIGGLDPKLKCPTPITNIYELAHELAIRGRQDSVTPSEIETAVDNLSSTMSDVSLGEQFDAHFEMAASSTTSMNGAAKLSDSIDPRLLGNGEGGNGYHRMAIEVVEVGDDRVDSVESLALHGGLDPMMDPETLTSALS